MENNNEIEVAFEPQLFVDAVMRIDKAMIALNSSNMRRSTLINLIHADTKVSKKDIEKVIKNLSSFKDLHLVNIPTQRKDYGALEPLMVDAMVNSRKKKS